MLSPYALKGEFGRDVEMFFVPVVLAAIAVENRGLWIAGISGLIVGFTHMAIINSGQGLLGVWFGEYGNIINVVFLAMILYMKDRRLKLPSWAQRRIWSFVGQ